MARPWERRRLPTWPTWPQRCARDVPAVFVDAGSSHALAETLASEGDVAVEVVELNTESLGPPGSDSADYVSMLTAAAERIAEALR